MRNDYSLKVSVVFSNMLYSDYIEKASCKSFLSTLSLSLAQTCSRSTIYKSRKFDGQTVIYHWNPRPKKNTEKRSVEDLVQKEVKEQDRKLSSEVFNQQCFTVKDGILKLRESHAYILLSSTIKS